MSATTVQLLRAAAEAAGGDKALAERLGISERVLVKFMADTSELPDVLLLRVVDIILAERHSRPLPASQPGAQCPRACMGDD